MKNRKILFLATYFPDEMNPSRGNWALEQAQAFQQAGLEVRVIVPTPWIPRFLGRLSPKLANYSDTPDQIHFGNLPVDYPRWPCYPWHVFHLLNHRFPDKIISFGWHFAENRIDNIINDFQPDFLFAHHTLVAGQLALKMARKHELPFVVTDHEIGDLLNCKTNRKVNRIFTDVGEQAKRMVVVSKAMEKVAKQALPSIEFSTIYNGSSFNVFDRSKEEKKTGTVTVFCCSKFYGRKDIPLLLRAFDAVVEKGFDMHLRIAGDGPDRAQINECLNALAHKDRITLLGLLPSSEILDEMRKADIFALVGWAEPFGVVFLEAMASGLPLVVSEDAGVAEILRDGKTALFTRPRNQDSVESALIRLTESPELRCRIGSAGQHLFVERFQWSNVITEYIQLIEEQEEQS